MEIVNYLLIKFFKEEKINTFIIFLLSLLLTIFQTNIISYVSATIIQAVENNNFKDGFNNFYTFIGVSFIYLFIYRLYRNHQNNFLSKMPQWIKKEIIEIIFKINNVNISNVNFIEFITPITRIAMSCYVLFFDLISVMLPTLSFLIIISAYFLYKNSMFGILFFIANILIIVYCAYFWEVMLKEKSIHENKINDNEKIIVDLLNNIDKVIYRGEIENEIENYSLRTDEGIDIAITYINYITNHTFFITIFVYIIIFISIFYLIILTKNKKIDSTTFITFFTILLLYRDTILHLIQNIPDYLEFIGKLDYISVEFNKMLGDKQNTEDLINLKYEPVELEFDNIDFKNVSFKYPNTKKNIFKDFNFHIDFNKNYKIFGITGMSGKGKSTFVKLMLRLYDCDSGVISIDGVNIKEIDPTYIRSNITYVNQNSKLFDKKVIDNIMYGCKDNDKCSLHLKEILEYSKIQSLYQNIDLYKTNSGSLGENLSGGQRQVVNIISGLINPSKILILDEPTNALDMNLKNEIISIISTFKNYKKAIIIITHDRDLNTLFDKVLKL